MTLNRTRITVVALLASLSFATGVSTATATELNGRSIVFTKDRCWSGDDGIDMRGYYKTSVVGYYRLRFALFTSAGGRVALGPLGQRHIAQAGSYHLPIPTWTAWGAFDVPRGSQIRAYVFRWNGAGWPRVAEKNFNC